jgi:hypothetical protein
MLKRVPLTRTTALTAVSEPPAVRKGEACSHGDMNRCSVSNVSPAFPAHIIEMIDPAEGFARTSAREAISEGFFAPTRARAA